MIVLLLMSWIEIKDGAIARLHIPFHSRSSNHSPSAREAPPVSNVDQF